jgi:hypothetical protein
MDPLRIYAGSWHNEELDDRTHEPASMKLNKLEPKDG